MAIKMLNQKEKKNDFKFENSYGAILQKSTDEIYTQKAGFSTIVINRTFSRTKYM